MKRITGEELMNYLNDRVKKFYSKKKSSTIKKDLDLVKADAVHIKAHPSKEDINELIEDINKSQKSIKGGTIYRTYNHGSKDPVWAYKNDGQELLVTTKKGKTEDQDDIRYDSSLKGYKEQAQAIIDGSINFLSKNMGHHTPDERIEFMLMNQEDKPKGNRLQLTARDIGIAERGPTVGFNKDKELLIRKALKPHGLEIPKTPAELRVIKDKVSKEEYRSIVSHNLKMTQGYNEVNTPAFQRAIDSQLLEQKLKYEDEGSSASTKARLSAYAKLEQSQKGVVDELIKSEESKKKKDKKKKEALKVSSGAAEEPSEEAPDEPEVEYELNPELRPKEEPVDKPTKGKKDKSLINSYEIDIDIKRIQMSGEFNTGEAFEEVLLQPKYSSILQKTFGDSSELHPTSSIPALQDIILSTGMPLTKACIYDMYSSNNVFELKNFHELSYADISKKGGLFINVSKLIGSELYRPEFYTEDGEVKLFNVNVGVMDKGVRKDFKLFNKSGKTLHFIYNLSDGVYKYDISNDKEFELVPLLDSKGTQIKKNGKKIMVYNPVQPRVVQGTFLGKQCFVLNPRHLHKI
jgi:hypothetical protein